MASKVDFDFLYSWIRKPSDFRPTTKMPQFFGLSSHLDAARMKDSLRFEPIEIRGIADGGGEGLVAAAGAVLVEGGRAALPAVFKQHLLVHKFKVHGLRFKAES